LIGTGIILKQAQQKTPSPLPETPSERIACTGKYACPQPGKDEVFLRKMLQILKDGLLLIHSLRLVVKIM
jgi:hypothetical protein